MKQKRPRLDYGTVGGLEPPTNGVKDISSLCALPLSYTVRRLYIVSITEAV